MRFHVLAFGLSLVLTAPLEAQRQQPAAQQSGAAAGTAGAAEAGTTAGAGKSTAGLGFVSGSLSFAVPLTGFVYLAFLKSGEVQPNFAEQAFLKDKSPEYTRIWVDSYDRALTKKQKKTIIIASTVGSVAGYFLLYKPLMDRPSY